MTTTSTIEASEYTVPGRSHGLLDVFRRHYLLRLLVRKDTATRYRNSALGWVWSYVKPLCQYVIYFFIMGVIMGNTRGIENFSVYLLSGIIAINYFNEAFSNATTSITGNRALVRKVYLPRELFPVSAVIVAFIHFLPQLAVLVIIAMLTGWVPSLVTLGAGLLGILILTLLSIGLGLMFGAWNAMYKDAQNFVEIIRMFATWTAPVLYSWTSVADKLPHWAATLYMINPLSSAVELFHLAFWYTGSSESMMIYPNLLRNSMIAVGFCLVLLIIGQLIFKRLEPRFAQEV